ncbi:MAG TPA: tetratricopeptide repeat protein [Flavisolibacter sp.]|nr:tetratricopeptide repeat protein [Flavisolibacter sp.]
MKAICLPVLLLLFCSAIGQTKKPKNPQQPSQKEMQNMMKEMQQAMEGLSAEEKAQMEKIMKGVMTTSATTAAPMAVSFNDNKLLVGKRDLQRISRIPQKAFTDADFVSNALQLSTKLQAKMAPAQKAIVTKVLAQAKTADEINAAAITALLQGHSQTAMALALKAVQSSPKNPAYQGNLAATLSQSGYPDKAIPYLKKLAAEFPNNSTVLHNLGFAWLQLGETDTAQRLFGAAAIRNPNNPETKICQGVIHELQGDPQKALEAYKEAFELSPNGFTTDLMKNAGDENKWQTVDFEKLKSNITIHEYFSRKWIAVPKLADNVSSFNNDAAIQRGYEEMFEKLTATLDSLNEGSIQDFTQLADQDLKTFVGTMMAETQKGINVMSKAAAYIDMIMQIYIADWHSRFMQEHLELKMKIEEDRKQMTASKPGERCEAMDRKANAFMEHINPIIRKFHAEKIEELRVWLNAYCTWAPYVVGNPKNMVLNRCLNWTAMLARMYANAVADQVTIAPVCKYQAGDGSTFVPVPEIPSIHCKTPVKMPLGMKDIQLTAETINLNANQWGIAKASNTPMPNLTLSFGLNRGLIGEPGKFGRPFAKAGGGGLSFSGHNASDDELTPLTKIQDQLTPLDPMLLPEQKRERVQDMQAKKDAELSKKLLEQFTSKDCNTKPTYITKIGPVAFVEWDAKKGEWVEVPEPVSGENDPYILGVGFVEFVDNRSTGKQGEKTFDAVTGVSLIEIVDAPSANTSSRQMIQQQISNTLKSGLQAVISNGLGAASSVANTIRNLFD